MSSGRILNEVFKGAVDDLTLVTAGGLELRQPRLPMTANRSSIFTRDDVFCRIQPEDINVVSS
jgi:hypothetical protein